MRVLICVTGGAVLGSYGTVWLVAGAKAGDLGWHGLPNSERRN
jgi:hypothetical protein